MVSRPSLADLPALEVKVKGTISCVVALSLGGIVDETGRSMFGHAIRGGRK